MLFLLITSLVRCIAEEEEEGVSLFGWLKNNSSKKPIQNSEDNYTVEYNYVKELEGFPKIEKNELSIENSEITKDLKLKESFKVKKSNKDSLDLEKSKELPKFYKNNSNNKLKAKKVDDFNTKNFKKNSEKLNENFKYKSDLVLKNKNQSKKNLENEDDLENESKSDLEEIFEQEDNDNYSKPFFFKKAVKGIVNSVGDFIYGASEEEKNEEVLNNDNKN